MTLRNRLGVALFSFVNLDRNSHVPLFLQLDSQIRQAILSGRLASGLRLPSSRVLAKELGISRTSVVMAFEQLIAEDFLEGRVGAGTFIGANITEQILEPLPPDRIGAGREKPEVILSRRGALVAKSPSNIPPLVPTAFLPNQPAYDQFPFNIWARLASRRVRQPEIEMLNYGPPHGYPPLRRAIAAYLRDARGIKCDADQIVVVAGAQMALSLTAWILLNPGDAVLMEDPCYLTIRDMFIGFGASLVNVPVDKNGMDVSAGVASKPDARMALVAPSHQYPMGVTLSLPRRLELLAWATRNKSWVVEDDYDSEFRFSGAPLAPMQTIDRNGRVIYIGTFSKVLFPSLRIGYLVVPPGLVDAYGAAVHLLTRGMSTLTQAVLADFIDSGYFTNHVRRMRLVYAERQEALVGAIRGELDGLMNVTPARAGMNAIGWLPRGSDDVMTARKMMNQGIMSGPMSYYFTEQQPRAGLFLGFSCSPVEKIPPAVQQMARVLGG
jgi:GntR family transcriptional regulator/MocR family aminotransferase